MRSGERVTLTVHGEPVADIVPHRTRSEIDLGLPVVTHDDDYDQMAEAHAPLLAPMTSQREQTAR